MKNTNGLESRMRALFELDQAIGDTEAVLRTAAELYEKMKRAILTEYPEMVALVMGRNITKARLTDGDEIESPIDYDDLATPHPEWGTEYYKAAWAVQQLGNRATVKQVMVFCKDGASEDVTRARLEDAASHELLALQWKGKQKERPRTYCLVKPLKHEPVRDRL